MIVFLAVLCIYESLYEHNILNESYKNDLLRVMIDILVTTSQTHFDYLFGEFLFQTVVFHLVVWSFGDQREPASDFKQGQKF